jgi:Fur family ferric uptake transcriptional regulator
MFAEPTDDDITLRLRALGLSRTQTRLAVLRYLMKIGRPVSHAEVAAALRDRSFDRVSVYRALIDLTRVKILSRTDMGGRVWRFDIVRGDRPHCWEHAHFVCSRCGAISCLPVESVRIGTRGKLPRAIKAKQVEVQVKGECDACNAQLARRRAERE